MPPPLIVHLNGRLIPLEQASISPLDRGFLFGDGVYEGLRSIPTAPPAAPAPPATSPPGRRIIGARGHIERMRRGLALTQIDWDPAPLEAMSNELTLANGLTDAFVYWQVTRGTPGPNDPVRSRAPAKGMRPTVFGYCTPQPTLDSFTAPPTKSVVTCEDRRWLVGHLKSISLMGNILGALQADEARADEAILIRNGLVAEGLATNVVLALPASSGQPPTLVTPSLDSVSILAGVTRAILLKARPDIQERAVREEELARAAEIMMIGTTTMVTSIVRINGRPVGDGTPGPIARDLLACLLNVIRSGRDSE